MAADASISWEGQIMPIMNYTTKVDVFATLGEIQGQLVKHGAKKIMQDYDNDGHLPATFMVVAPGSWTDQVWDDINRMRTLNTTQSQRRKENHVCPLQLDIVDRLINRYSNLGDLVLDPFGGLGTVALEAIKAGRRGYTIELNNDYFRDAVGYLKEFDESQQNDNLCLFDVI